MVEIRLRNSMTRKVEPLEPTVRPGQVSMYVCGPTVYDRAHLGNARPVLVFDVLYRLLGHVYGPSNVAYVRNITDVEDKIIDRAAEREIDIDELTRMTTEWFHDDMAALGVDYRADPSFREPRATEFISEMVAMIETLIDRGHAYAAEGHVLFDVRSFNAYGSLSGRSVEAMIAGARVEVAPYKQDPMDFVLWKPSSDDQPGWDSPWGRGRPGWHIECSAMSRALLGDSFDIHGGGIDLQFPHHENEIAQSCCAHPDGGFARIWMHNEMLQVEGKKMSKSLGNFFTVRDLLDDGVPGEVIRFVMLSTHYSKPMDWTDKKRDEAEKTLRRWRELTDGAAASAPDGRVVAALSDDLNTAGAIGVLHGLAADGDAAAVKGSASLIGLLGDELSEWGWKREIKTQGTVQFVGFGDATQGATAQELAERWQSFRTDKDFAAADELKAKVREAGVELRVLEGAVQAEALEDFDPAKLEALR